MFDLILRGGRVSAGAGATEICDVAIADGAVAALGAEIEGRATEVLDASGCYVLPGVVDPHVHVSGRFGSPIGCRMLVRGGVTAALDLAGDAQDLRKTLATEGCLLTVGVLHALVPGDTVRSDSPSEQAIEALLDQALEQGALGLKVLGGHFPLTPEATRTVIEVCARRSAYCAIHAGTTETGSDITGVEELLELAGELPVHVAHVNSYCRGQIESPTMEAARAIDALAGAPNAWSDSYLSILNGAEARCRDGVPESGVVRTCLRLGGFDETGEGLERAILAGWGRIQAEIGDEIGFLEAQAGLERFRLLDSDVGISFPVNPPASALALALARRADRSFIVDALGSDGGSIPRNTTLEQGVRLVQAGVLTLDDLVLKLSRTPALRLGLNRKGRLEPGADADVIVVGADGLCRDSVIGGRIAMRDRVVVSTGGGRLLERLS